MGKTTYEIESGEIVITDRRQLTNGAIVPNFVVDLYLPIIGFVGLGLLTTLYRLANTNGEVMAKLRDYMKAGGIGYDKLITLLDLLQSLGLITYKVPVGTERIRHYRTTITLLDAPVVVPSEHADIVLNKSISGWLIERPCSQTETPEFPGRNSTSSQPGTPQVPNQELHRMYPLDNVPIDHESSGVRSSHRADINGGRQLGLFEEDPAPPGNKSSRGKKKTDPRIKPLLDAYAALLPIGEKAGLNWGQEGRGAQKLLTIADALSLPIDVLIEQMVIYYAELKQKDYCATRHVSLMELAKNFGAWYEAGVTSKAAQKPVGERKPPTPIDDGLTWVHRDYWRIGRRMQSSDGPLVCVDSPTGPRFVTEGTNVCISSMAEAEQSLKFYKMEWQ